MSNEAQTSETPEAKEPISRTDAIRLYNSLPGDWPRPENMATLQRLYKEAMHRLLNGMVRTIVTEKEGGRFPEPPVVLKNLSIDLSPSGMTCYRWRSEAIVMFTPAGWRMSDAPGEGIVWEDARVDVLADGSKVVTVGGS